MRIKFTSIFCVASLFLGLQSQSSFAQCDTASITGDLTFCANDTTILSGTPSDVWNQVSDFNESLAGGVAFSIGNKGYYGLGVDDYSYLSQFFWEYDQTTDTWSQKASFVDGRYLATGFSLGNKGYVGLGQKNDPNSLNNLIEMDDFWEFDPVANTWTQKANYPGGIRFSAFGFGIGTNAYVGGGGIFDSNTPGNSIYYVNFWEFNPANNTWTQKGDIPKSIMGNVQTVGNNAYAFCGYDGTSSDYNVYQYNPTNDSWATLTTTYPGLGGAYMLGFAIGNVCYVGLGVSVTTYDTYSDFWAFNTVSNVWTELKDYSGGTRSEAAAFAVGNRGYVIGGVFDYNVYLFSDEVWEYTPPAAYSWSSGDTTQSITVANAGTYTLNMTFPFTTGCSASSAVATVVHNVIPTLSVAGADSICWGNSTTLTANGGASFVWSTGDSIASITVSPMNDTTYYVTVADTNGCSATDSITVFVSVCSGINELAANQNISLYPNPASNLVKVSAKGALLETIKIYNLTGALVYEQAASKSEEVLNINIPAGVYYMHLKTDAGTNIKKFVVQ